jgi:hypothetical protein
MKIQVIKSRPIQEPISSCQLKIRSEADRERSARQKYAVNRSVQFGACNRAVAMGGRLGRNDGTGAEQTKIRQQWALRLSFIKGPAGILTGNSLVT